jgi:two-component system chemotaxis response regulator CheB
MLKARVLVVDDSVVVRRMVSDALSSDAGIEVCGTAPNGKIALAKLTQLQPDVITLDVEMPELNGLETLVEIRKVNPRVPVIMFSTVTSKGAAATLDALASGATDYVTKPSNVGSVGEALQRLRDDLIPKIKHLTQRSRLAPAAVVKPPAALTRPRVGLAAGRVDAIVIGVSTGGPDALSKVIPALPGDLPAPVLIVQHMPPLFTKLLAQRLESISALRVREAVHGEVISGPGVWLAPGDFHFGVTRSGAQVTAQLNQGQPENSCRPAADVLFRSASAVYGRHLLGVVLTGMGQDGLRGSEVIVDAGGEVIAQDEATCVVWGMPGFIVRAGLASAVLPLSQMAEMIIRRALGRQRPSLYSGAQNPPKPA